MADDFQSAIDTARKAGYSDGEIQQYILNSPQGKIAQKEGYGNDEIIAKFFPSAGAIGGQFSQPDYDVWRRTANAEMLGQGSKVSAAIQASKMAAEDISSGVPTGEAFDRAFGSGGNLEGNKAAGNYYRQAQQQFQGASDKYAKENPVTAATADIAGSMIPTAAGLSALNAAKLAVLPTSLARFVTGGAGYGGAGEALPGTINSLTRLTSQGTAGALQGAEAGAITSPLSDRPFGEQVATGAALGGPIGAVFGTGANALTNTMRGKPITPEVAALGQRLVDMGVPLKAAQLQNPGSGFTGSQASAVTRALTRTFGENSAVLDSKTLHSAVQRIGGDFNASTAGLTIDANANPQLLTDLSNIRTKILSTVFEPAQQKALLRNVENVEDNLMTGGMKLTGKDYQDLTSWQSPLTANTRNKDPAVRQLANEIRDSLDNAVEAASPPDKLAQFQKARSEWKNMLIGDRLAKLKSTAGGTVDPGSIMPAVSQRYPDIMRSGADKSDIEHLAIGARDFLSGPQAGQNWFNKFGLKGLITADVLGGAGFAGAEYMLQHPMAAAGAATAATVPLVVGGALHRMAVSPKTTEALIQRAITQPGQSLGAPWLIPPAVAGTNQLLPPNQR